MHSPYRRCRPALVCLLALAAGGCGDSLLTALAKIGNGMICQLTAGEVRILNQAAADLGRNRTPPVEVPLLTPAQSAAVADVLRLNGLCTPLDFQALPQRIQQGRPLEGLRALADAFTGSDAIDPATLDVEGLVALLLEILGIGG
jgi:hypothetical protein